LPFDELEYLTPCTQMHTVWSLKNISSMGKNHIRIVRRQNECGLGWEVEEMKELTGTANQFGAGWSLFKLVKRR